MITQKALAEQLGISYSTVSLALAGSSKVNEQTRKLVCEAAGRAGYCPDLNAKALKNRRSGLVGVVFPDFSQTYYTELQREIYPKLQAAGYTGLFFTCGQNDDFGRIVRELHGRHVDGIITCITDATALRPLLNSGVKVVMYRSPEQLPCSSVEVDRIKGGRMAAEHLIGLGYRRLGYLGFCNQGREDRLQGYLSGIAAAGLEIDSAAIIECDCFMEAGYEGMKKMLKKNNRPEAIFVFNDSTALGAIRAIYEAGLQVPRDIAIVGFDGITEGRFSIPALTTIAQPKTATAENLVNLLTAHISGEETGIRRVVLTPELLIRESCGAKR